MSKKLISTENTEFAQNGQPFAIIDDEFRAGKPTMLSAATLDEAFNTATQEDQEAFKEILSFDVEGEEIEVVPTTNDQVITPSVGKNAITKVTVEGVGSDIDENIQPENIRSGVSILGVEGNLSSDQECIHILKLDGSIMNYNNSTQWNTDRILNENNKPIFLEIFNYMRDNNKEYYYFINAYWNEISIGRNPIYTIHYAIGNNYPEFELSITIYEFDGHNFIMNYNQPYQSAQSYTVQLTNDVITNIYVGGGSSTSYFNRLLPRNTAEFNPTPGSYQPATAKYADEVAKYAPKPMKLGTGMDLWIENIYSVTNHVGANAMIWLNSTYWTNKQCLIDALNNKKAQEYVFCDNNGIKLWPECRIFVPDISDSVGSAGTYEYYVHFRVPSESNFVTYSGALYLSNYVGIAFASEQKIMVTIDADGIVTAVEMQLSGGTNGSYANITESFVNDTLCKLRIYPMTFNASSNISFSTGNMSLTNEDKAQIYAAIKKAKSLGQSQVLFAIAFDTWNTEFIDVDLSDVDLSINGGQSIAFYRMYNSKNDHNMYNYSTSQWFDTLNLSITVASGEVTAIAITGGANKASKYLPTDNTREYSPTNFYHPATKKYVDSLAAVESITNSDTTYTIADLTGHKSYKLGEITSLTVTASTASDYETNIYFESGSTPTEVTMPNTITNLGDAPVPVSGVMTCTANKKYIISVLNDIAIWREY